MSSINGLPPVFCFLPCPKGEVPVQPVCHLAHPDSSLQDQSQNTGAGVGRIGSPLKKKTQALIPGNCVTRVGWIVFPPPPAKYVQILTLGT